MSANNCSARKRGMETHKFKSLKKSEKRLKKTVPIRRKSLLDLPPEVVFHILEYLDCRTVVSLKNIYPLLAEPCDRYLKMRLQKVVQEIRTHTVNPIHEVLCLLDVVQGWFH